MNDTLYEFAAAVGAFGVAAGEALRDMLNKIGEAGKPVIKSLNDLYYNELAAALGNEAAKKRLRQQSIRDRRQQLERSSC